MGLHTPYTLHCIPKTLNNNLLLQTIIQTPWFFCYISMYLFLVNEAETANEIDLKEARDTLGKAKNKSTEAEWRKQVIEANLAFKRAKVRLEAINIHVSSITNSYFRYMYHVLAQYLLRVINT